MTIQVGRLAPGDQWDSSLLDELFAGRLYPTGLDFRHVMGYPNAQGCCLIVPGRYWHTHTEQITEALATYEWVLAFRTSDEEDLFDIAAVSHPNVRWWVQSPKTGRDYGDARLFGIGFSPHFTRLPPEVPTKDLDLFLSAQRTHARRDQAFDALEQAQSLNALIQSTDGFTQGLPAPAYTAAMMRAKVAPAPAGPVTPDTFRLFEALEAHAVPIADDNTPGYDSAGYWRRLYPDAPFPVLLNYESLVGYTQHLLSEWPACANRSAAWWIRQKRRYAMWLREDLEALGAL